MSLADRTPPTPDEYNAYKQRFSNWGRWGTDDQLGTLNHITPETHHDDQPLGGRHALHSLEYRQRGPDLFRSVLVQ